jgi:RNA polymerase sigma factor (sigma-70 family)
MPCAAVAPKPKIAWSVCCVRKCAAVATTAGASCFYNRHSARVVGWLEQAFFAGDFQTAEEAWNDTLYRVWSRVEKYDEARSRFTTWVWNQARYAALDLRRKRRTGREIPYAGEEPSYEQGEKTETDLLRRRLDEDAIREFEEPDS